MEKDLQLLYMVLVEVYDMFQTALMNEFYNQEHSHGLHKDPCGLSIIVVDPHSLVRIGIQGFVKKN
jgi:hypothetical protein